MPRAQVLYHFGRVDQLHLNALGRLVRSIVRFLPPLNKHRSRRKPAWSGPSPYSGACKLGGTWVLDELWRPLRIQKTQQHRYQTPVERLIVALVANRALAPMSKLALKHRQRG